MKPELRNLSYLSSQAIGYSYFFISSVNKVETKAAKVVITILPVTPVSQEQLKSKSNFKTCLKQVINVSIWRKKRYVVWASSIPLALFGSVLLNEQSS